MASIAYNKTISPNRMKFSKGIYDTILENEINQL